MATFRERLRRFLRFYVYHVLFCLVFLALFWLRFRDPSWDRAVERDYPKNPSEKQVAAKLIDSLSAPQFKRWGPHMTTKEVNGFSGWPGRAPDACVRVVFTTVDANGKELEWDWVFALVGEKVEYFGWNDHGDNWKEKAKEGKWPRNPPKW